MLLYHGSNVQVDRPKILSSNRAMDFGAGFYTTSDENQAMKWAKIQTLRRKKGIPIVSVYEFDENAAKDLSVLSFCSADKNWLDFVAENRKNLYCGMKYDIVRGPVANDTTMTIISDYMAGNISDEVALLLLKTQKLSDQYVFLTESGIDCLRFKEVR